MKKPLRELEQFAMFKEALSQTNTLADLSMMYENAIDMDGLDFASAQVTKSRRGLGFRITIQLDDWVREHVDAQSAEAEKVAFETRPGTTLPVTPAKDPSWRNLLQKLLDKGYSLDEALELMN